MNVKFSVRRDNGADYLPQRIERVMTLAQAEDAVTVAIVAAFGYSDAAFTAAEMRGTLEKKTATAWGWNDNTRRLTIRVEKVTA